MKKYEKDIRREVSWIEMEREEASAVHNATIKELDKQLITVRKKCQHIGTEYYPDASGNNDSWTECKWCGAEV